MLFEIQGPFELDRWKGLVDDSADACSAYWKKVNKRVKKGNKGLSEACGCYIFAIQTTGGALPWYVGKAESQPFKKECLTDNKINRYNKALAERSGKPVLFFIPQLTKKGAYRKPKRKSIQKSSSRTQSPIHKLESMLMAMAKSRNPGLLNKRGLGFFLDLTVRGFINSGQGRATKPAAALRKLLNK